VSAAGPGIEPPGATTVLRASVDDVDTYTRVVAGLKVEAVRAGTGRGPNRITSVSDGRISANAPSIGFPTLVRTAIGDENLAFACVESAPRGSHWCGRDINDGELYAYGPGTEHVGVNVPGLEFKFVVVRVDDLQQCADELGLWLGDVDRAFLTRLGRSPKALAAARSLVELFRLPGGRNPPRWRMDELLTVVARGLAQPRVVLLPGVHEIIDSRRVVNTCVELARRIERRPTLRELCRAAVVSERSLRQAFIDEFDLPPTQFFRLWALSEAHRRLVSGQRYGDTVTRVALDVGFGHLGRFAEYYRAIYGESPSQTLGGGPAMAPRSDAAENG
jgi:AraC-like DNA-binding protein